MIGGVAHLIPFFCVIITLLVLAPRSTNDFVWTTVVSDLSGWSNPGVGFCIGLLAPTFVVSGFDGVIHMSDEVKDAPRRVPRSIWITVVVNAVFCWAFSICLLYCIGDYTKVLESPTGLPFIEVIYEATKSKPATNTLVVFVLLVSTIGNFSIIASVSRLTWAFARDRGLPYSEFFSYVCYSSRQAHTL
jgi:choline transport protein